MSSFDVTRTSVVTRVREALERIAALNPSLNAFISVFDAEAMAQAEILDAELQRGLSRGPLHGCPISVKDIIDVEGTPTTAASRVRAGILAPVDAVVVTRLRAAGAIIIGKCNLHEFALGTTNEESAFGPAHNPRDLSRSPGGSSGGSAAAVAAGMGWASIGTDTGGSIRIPAAACGVVGLKPTVGDVPTSGVVPLSVSLDHVGPIARTVTDAWAIHSVLTGKPLPEMAAKALWTCRFGKLSGYFLEKLDASVQAVFEAALERLRSNGASIVELRIERAAEIPSIYANIVLPEAAAYHEKTLKHAPDDIGAGVRQRLQAGREIPLDDYMQAQEARALFRSDIDAALSTCDALVLPTLPIPAPKIGATTVAIGSREEDIRPLMLRLTQLFNLTGHPAITLPCGDTPEGLPCGLQLVGRRNETNALLSVALSCESYVTPPAH